MTTVTMHFGDGSFKEIEVEADDPAEAAEEAVNWVHDNAFFLVQNDNGDVLAEDRFA